RRSAPRLAKAFGLATCGRRAASAASPPLRLAARARMVLKGGMASALALARRAGSRSGFAPQEACYGRMDGGARQAAWRVRRVGAWYKRERPGALHSVPGTDLQCGFA